MVRVTSNCCSHSAFKSHTASGSDGVSCHILRATARAITPAITSIFNKSLEQSKLPNDWKTSNVTPILKHGDPSSVLNYRPISLLPLLSKLLERIVHNKISNFLYSNKLLSNCQFGFRPRSSTQEALLSATHCWHQRVVLDGTVSHPAPVTSGVPQGSILGPLLFNIHMNSISSLPLSQNARLFCTLMTSFYLNLLIQRPM